MLTVLKCHKGSEVSWGPLQICHVLELQRLNQLHTWQANKGSFRSVLRCSFRQVLHPSIDKESGSQQVSPFWRSSTNFLFLAERVVWRAFHDGYRDLKRIPAGAHLGDSFLARAWFGFVSKSWTYVRHTWYLPMRQHGWHAATHRHKTDFTQQGLGRLCKTVNTQFLIAIATSSGGIKSAVAMNRKCCAWSWAATAELSPPDAANKNMQCT